MKTIDLSGDLLDYWVARSMGHKPIWPNLNDRGDFSKCCCGGRGNLLGIKKYSTDPKECWNIIEYLRIQLFPSIDGIGWISYFSNTRCYGETLLISVCRCFVQSKFGDDVSDEFTESMD